MWTRFPADYFLLLDRFSLRWKAHDVTAYERLQVRFAHRIEITTDEGELVGTFFGHEQRELFDLSLIDHRTLLLCI